MFSYKFSRHSIFLTFIGILFCSTIIFFSGIGSMGSSSLISTTETTIDLENENILYNHAELQRIISIKDGVVVKNAAGESIFYGVISTTVRGSFFAFNLDKKVLLDQQPIEAQGAWNVKEKNGKIYFGTYYPAILYEYIPETKVLSSLTKLSGSLEYIWDVTFLNDEVYMGTFDGEPVKYNLSTKTTTTLLNLSSAKYSRSIEAVNGKVYIGFGGARKDTNPPLAELVEYDPTTGTSTQLLSAEDQYNMIPNDMAVVDNKVIIFYSVWNILQYDPVEKTFKWLTKGNDFSGAATGGPDVFIFKGVGGAQYEYNKVKKTLLRVSQVKEVFINNEEILGVSYEGLVTRKGMDGKIKESYSLGDYGVQGESTLPYSIAVHEDKVVTAGTQFRIYDTRLKSEKYYSAPGEPKVMAFTNGVLFSANYALGNLWKYSGENLVESNAAALASEARKLFTFGEEQIRPKGIAAKNGKVLIGTEPGYSLFGGALVFYDSITGEQYTQRNIVQNHTIHSVTFDDQDETIAYLGTSAIGGTGVEQDALLETAHLVKWSIPEKRIIWDVIPKPVENARYDRTIKRVVSSQGKLYAITSFGDLLLIDASNGNLLTRKSGEAYVDLLLSPSQRFYATKGNCFGELERSTLNFTCIKDNIAATFNLLTQDEATQKIYFNDKTTLWSFDEERYMASRSDTGDQSSFASKNNFTILPQEFYQNEGGHAYSYAPSIIKENDTYHVFVCSVPKDERGVVGDGAWDYIRYTKSTDDGKTWSTPEIVIKSKMNAEGVDRSACDPSVVYYEGYYYMYYGSVYRTGYINEVPQYYTHIQVARAESIGGPYKTFTTRNTWEILPSDPKPIIYPYHKAPQLTGVPLVGEQSLGYGAGQPTVVVKDNALHLWYLDTSRFDAKEISSPELVLLTSNNPVEWGRLTPDGKNWSSDNAKILSGVAEFGIGEVKYDTQRKKFVSVVLHDNHSLASSLWFTESSDGMFWSSARSLVSPAGFPNFAHNIGMEGDKNGHISQNRIMAAFGSVKNYESQYDSWGSWDLTGTFVSLEEQSPQQLLPGIPSEQYLEAQIKNIPLIRESSMTSLFDTSFLLDKSLFDWKYYTQVNGDLASMNEEQARFHWRNYGSMEGRRAHPDFFAKYYILENPELAKILKWSADDLRTYVRATQHYYYIGKYFGKKGTLGAYTSASHLLHSKVFDWEFYTRKPKYESLYAQNPEISSRNNDLTFMNEEQAKNHWIHFGIYEGRPSSPTFWITKYMRDHPELKDELGTAFADYSKYTVHFVKHLIL